MKLNRPYTVAITGGISTGKSTALNYIKMRGYEVIEFDLIGHFILKDNFVINQLVQNFGNNILSEDGEIDRRALGKLVFSNKEKLNILNQITHGKIYELAQEKINLLKDEKIIFLDIPLLFETKNNFVDFYKGIDEIWVVSSREAVQITRLMIRDKITLEEAQNKIRSQMNLKVKERLADQVLYNNSDVYELYDEIRIELNNLEKRVSLNYEG